MGFNPDEARDDHGRWSGGGASQASHANGVPSLNHAAVAPAVLDVVHNNPSGFSVTLASQQPTDGYMVATQGNTQIVHADALKGPGGAMVIADYVQARADALAMPGAHIGGWTQGNRVYLDVSQRVASRDAALKLGAARNQIAIFNVGSLKDIPRAARASDLDVNPILRLISLLLGRGMGICHGGIDSQKARQSYTKSVCPFRRSLSYSRRFPCA